MKPRRPQLSPMECRILSELEVHGGDAGISGTQLARLAKLCRGTLYVLLGRLAAASPARVRRRRARVPGRNEHQVLYTITSSGRRARERFAADVGLNPH